MYFPVPRNNTFPNSMNSGFFILRTYALWNKNKFVLGTMLTAALVSPMYLPHPKLLVDPSIRLVLQHPSAFSLALLPLHHVCTPTSSLALHNYSHCTFTVDTSTIPAITGCYRNSNSIGLFLPFLLLFAFELGVLQGASLYRPF